ncbi:MAG: 6-bladed beta-propeller [Bacteroidaceae bacterium]|nr:6-bladed beta-propeller [Bacteroidaceae bacterium]
MLTSRVKYDDGLFFVGSRQPSTDDIKVFDSAGHYLHDISHQGRAKYEYLGIAEWTLDPVWNEVVIIDFESSYQIKYYDYSGKFLRMLDLGDEYSAWSYGMEPV